MSNTFLANDPTEENRWRAIILFGRNVASYKFALGKSLLELAGQEKNFVTLDELAVPFSRNLCEHLALNNHQLQGKKTNTKFLNACRDFNNNQISNSDLIESTVRNGFVNVIDAFHNVGTGGQTVGCSFYEDERKSKSAKGIRIRDEILKLTTSQQSDNLCSEIEARWRLVETAWGLQIPVSTVSVSYDKDIEELFINTERGRVSITGCRDALSGYQKGHCFYCSAYISTVSSSNFLAEVDHLIPHKLRKHLVHTDLNGVWNLVLSCEECNRGKGGKSDRLPNTNYLKNLYTRNEWYICSNHPLAETIINQTGRTTETRKAFLLDTFNAANTLMPSNEFWCPPLRL